MLLPEVKMKDFKKYLKVWWLMVGGAIALAFNSRIGAGMFLTGKVARFLLFFYFLYLLVSHTQTLAGYQVNQIIFFFLTFNLIDVGAQCLFRGVYVFRSLVISGQFDFDLIKPIRPLFRALAGRIDILDFMTLVPLLVLTIWLLPSVSGGSLVNSVVYWLLVVNGLVIALAFHVFALALGIVTLEIDHVVWIYRDLTSMGKIPVDVYKEPVRSLLTNIIPVGIMMTIPAKSLMGLTSAGIIVFSFGVGLVSVWLSLKYWRYALTKYSSASS